MAPLGSEEQGQCHQKDTGGGWGRGFNHLEPEVTGVHSFTTIFTAKAHFIWGIPKENPSYT